MRRRRYRGGCFAGNLALEASDDRESVRTRVAQAAALLGGGGGAPCWSAAARRASSGATCRRAAPPRPSCRCSKDRCSFRRPAASPRPSTAPGIWRSPTWRRFRAARAGAGRREPASIFRCRFLRIEPDGSRSQLGATERSLMSTVLNSLPAAQVRRRQEARKARRRFYPSTALYTAYGALMLAFGAAVGPAGHGPRLLRRRLRGLDARRVPRTPLRPARPLPGRRQRLPPAPAQVLRPAPLGAPRAPLGRQPRERHAEGHAAVFAIAFAAIGFAVSASHRAHAGRGPHDRVRVRGMDPSLRALLPVRQPLLPVHPAPPPLSPQPEGHGGRVRPHATASGTSCGTRASRKRSAPRSTPACIGRRIRPPNPAAIASLDNDQNDATREHARAQRKNSVTSVSLWRRCRSGAQPSRIDRASRTPAMAAHAGSTSARHLVVDLDQHDRAAAARLAADASCARC